MSNDINLTASMRTNLISLKSTNSLLAQTNERLATGRRVNDVADDPVSFFVARGLENRAGDLITVKDNLANNIVTLKTATDGLDSIEGLLKQAKGIAESARATTDTTERATLAAQYDSVLDQINQTAGDASFNGVNLLKATTPDDLTVTLNENGDSLTINGIASDQVGLAVTDANDWNNATVATGTTNIDADLVLIDAALSTVRSSAQTLGTNSAIIDSRVNFTTSLIENLQEGAGNLVNADLDEEAANLVALQTRQQLAVQALSISNQQQQSILALLRQGKAGVTHERN